MRRSFRPRIRPVINSVKNIHNAQFGVTSTLVKNTFAKSVSDPSSTVDNDVERGCIIKSIWVVIDMCGLGGTGVLNVIDVILMKNPGANLTMPNPISQGTSNEKKFIFKTWRYMAMRNQDGNPPYHWEGWVKIPKRYQRMGTDDLIEVGFVSTASVTGHASVQAIYKWFT